MLGFTPIEKFVEYIGACDIVLNLRYPTVGETSGSLQRALGLGKAVIVSDVGSFAELPDEICLKVPATPERSHEEEDFIFEYLNVLVSRPDLAQAMGSARQGVGGARMQLGLGGASGTWSFCGGYRRGDRGAVQRSRFRLRPRLRKQKPRIRRCAVKLEAVERVGGSGSA